MKLTSILIAALIIVFAFGVNQCQQKNLVKVIGDESKRELEKANESLLAEGEAKDKQIASLKSHQVELEDSLELRKAKQAQAERNLANQRRILAQVEQPKEYTDAGLDSAVMKLVPGYEPQPDSNMLNHPPKRVMSELVHKAEISEERGKTIVLMDELLKEGAEVQAEQDSLISNLKAQIDLIAERSQINAELYANQIKLTEIEKVKKRKRNVALVFAVGVIAAQIIFNP